MLTSYVAGTVPAIKAFDLNAIQATINDQINGEVTVAAVVIDGAGGSPVVPIPGTVSVSAVASGVAVPTPAVPWGTAYRDKVLFGGARILAGGGLVTGDNVKAINYTNPGLYEVVFHGQPTNVARLRADVSSHGNGAFFSVAGQHLMFDIDSISVTGTDIAVTVAVYDQTGNKQNGGFSLEVWGG